jgi:hypothetical protein
MALQAHIEVLKDIAKERDHASRSSRRNRTS